MIFGVGVDVVEVARFRRSFARYGERLALRILTAEELDGFRSARDPERFLAMRFAAKEAASKALGTGFRAGVSPRAIGVRQNAAGKPSLVFAARLDGLLERLGICASHVSLSDEHAYAVACVVLETEAERPADAALRPGP